MSQILYILKEKQKLVCFVRISTDFNESYYLVYICEHRTTMLIAHVCQWKQISERLSNELITRARAL